MLPILHLNGYKISNPSVLARIEPEELDQYLRGCGWTPRYVEGDDPEATASAHGECTGRGPSGTFSASKTMRGTAARKLPVGRHGKRGAPSPFLT